MTMQYKNREWNGKKVITGETELDSTRPVNLLIGFHGADSTPENMLIHGNRLQLNNAVMVFPEGPVDAGKGLWSWWPDGPRQMEGVNRFVDYTRGMVDEAQHYVKTLAAPSEVRTCLWGFSQGGAAALVYTLLGPHPLHKVASICGFLPEIPEGKAQGNSSATILGIFGLNDEVVPSFLAEHALEEMKTRGYPLILRETSQGHEVSAGNLKELTDFFNS